MFNEIFLAISLLIIMFLITFIITKFNEDNDGGDYVFSVLIRFIFAMFSSLCLFYLIKKIDAEKIGSYDKKIYKIYSLKNMNETSGSFVLGGGRIENTEYYYFYRRTNGAYFRGKIEVNYTLIYETNMVEPALYKKLYKFESLSGLIDWSDSNDDQTKYILKVPHGTISNRFEAY